MRLCVILWNCERQNTAKEEAGMDRYDYMREKEKEKESPLASRMRPATLDEIAGQKHTIGKDKLI